MSGSGNDFIMLDGRANPVERWAPEWTPELCDRRQGIGADGLVFLTPEAPNRVRMTFFNCDGSRAAMCGNAALCSTTLATYLEMSSPDGMSLATDAGTFHTRINQASGEAELNLPDFAPPRDVEGITRQGTERRLAATVVGVPHLVVLVDSTNSEDLMLRGRELRSHPSLGDPGANVNFISLRDGASETPWDIRTYERGVEGETLACGTGTVAAAAVAAQAGYGPAPIRMRTRSGRALTVTLSVGFDLVRNVWLAGEGRLVFQGVL
ncbi:MAG: diaminopimelate epimerase [Gemmatimonadota bacterium]